MPTLRSMSTTVGVLGACAAALATADVVWSVLYGELFLPWPVHSYLFWAAIALLITWRIEKSLRKVANTPREQAPTVPLDPHQIEACFQMFMDIIDTN